MLDLAFYVGVYFAASWATLVWVVVFTLWNKMPGGGSFGAVLFSCIVGLLVTAAVVLTDYLF